MKFSEAWLREWVDPDMDRAALLEQLTMAGLEVDGVDPVAGDFSGVVVARIESCEQHPDADKLKLCQVSDGADHYQVVCGAPNARDGLVTAFAKVGAVLPENFKIKKAKLRGVESFGMLCSAKELGMGDDHDGILELPETLPLGEEVTQALKLDDVTVDLDLTPNRGDCLSLKGIAREVGVLANASVSYPEIEPVPAVIDETFPVKLSAPQGCPRYLGRVIRGVDVTRPTPGWMVERLRRCGLRSIDPVVDVTNYLLIEMGQPMHAFDLNQLKGGIDVRMAQPDEKLTLLDGQEVSLDAQTLLITDVSGPVAIAGVMGGERSGVQPDTQDVFLECAFFAPLAIAGTARRYGLHTDASHRYERGVDFDLQHNAVERATRLLIEIVGGEPGPVVAAEDSNHLPQSVPVSLRQHRLDQLLGVKIPVEQVDECLSRLGLKVTRREETEQGVLWTVNSPSHRFDIAIEEDLVEEVCRVHGYNNIESRRPYTELHLREVELEAHGEPALKRQLIASDLQEVITYTFIDPSVADLFAPGKAHLELANPMSRDQSVMRASLLPGLVDALKHNTSRQQSRVRLFEVGRVFDTDAETLRQPVRVGGLIWGARNPEGWHGDNGAVDFFDSKGIVENLLDWAGIKDATFDRPKGEMTLHPGQSAVVNIADETVGVVGRLHPEIEAQLDVSGVYVFELSADAVLARPRRRYQGLSRYPSVRRDFSVLVSRDVSAAAVEQCVRAAAGEHLVEFTLFDVYEGKGIDSNEKSLAVGLTFQSQTATLKDEDINTRADAVVAALQEELNARQR